ncbi:MAG: arcadin 1 [Thaumarchaeota archaeon]|nr:arcadin 1 [Nitrososphaerota archaeon]
MTRVRIHRVTSINDPETGRPGKQVELVEVRPKGFQPVFPGVGEDEAKLVKNIVSQFQSMGIFPQIREMSVPKITLFLTEEEYDMLGIRFEVNDVHDLIMKDGSLTLKKVSEGI